MEAALDVQDVALGAIASGVPLLKAFRTYRGLTIAELGEHAAVPADDLARAEAGGTMSFDYLAAIADVLDVPAEMLLWHAARG
jgi:hypothetical protein